LEVQY